MRFSALAAVIALNWATSAFAQTTTPVAGAVAKPAGFDISLPFAAGEQVYITAGYSPSGGSSYHVNTNSTSSANDYYGLDLVLPGHSSGGLGQPVLAIASGTIARAGWATEGWASYGQRVIVVHDYVGDDNTYVSLYAHLNAIDVSEGQSVSKGQQLGTLGGSSMGSMTGTGYHLHFALHRNSSIGGSGTGGSYGGNAVVPELFDGYGLLSAGQTLTSSNSGGPTPPCQIIGDSGEVLDDQGPCFRRYGPASYWHDEDSGYLDHSVWTYTIAASEPDNWIQWNLVFDAAGDYEIRAYIPAGAGDATLAEYVVVHDGSTSAVVRDQSAVSGGWLSLGTFSFAAGDGQSVTLADNTGEPYTGTDSTRIVFDALAIVPASSTGDVDAGVDPPDGGGGDAPDDGGDERVDAGSGPGANDAGGDNAGVGGFNGGCNGAGTRPSLALLVLVAWWGWRRRRRASPLPGGF